ncbi:MliC family protein [Pasteurella sp. PK-2025]|uniref:MliC family protein n=1 Tax=unclassified Pasteurella TaxID=2621516 RepID=UPI003C71EB56
MKLNKATLLATLAAALSFSTFSAQATLMDASSKGDLTKVVYGCEGKKTLEVIYVNTAKDSFAIINQVGEMIPLEMVRSASGSLYKAINKDYTYQLQTKGRQAQLLGDGGNVVIDGCVTE